MEREPEVLIVDGDTYEPPAMTLIGSVADLTLRLHAPPTIIGTLTGTLARQATGSITPWA